jgi:hypothetical protein
VFILIGLVAAASAHPALGGPIALMGDPIFWPIDGLPGAPDQPVERLFAGIAGGLMVGWGTMLVWIGRGASLGRSLLTGGIAWFAIDGTASVLAGAPLNIVGNVVFLALIGWAASASERHSAEPSPSRLAAGAE